MTSINSGNKNQYNPDGELQTNNTDFYLTKKIDFASAQSNTILIEGVEGKHIEVHNIFISSSAQTSHETLTCLH